MLQEGALMALEACHYPTMASLAESMNPAPQSPSLLCFLARIPPGSKVSGPGELQ